MASRIRTFDWCTTSLGSSSAWPQSLRTIVDVMLALPGASTILWGPARIQIYNDAYVAIARDRHPGLLGRPAAEGWPDAYADVIAPLLAETDAGRAASLTGFAVELQGPDGCVQQRVFDTVWSPLRDETGAIAGALQTLTEVTDGHRVSAALQASEARLTAAFESVPVGVAVLDTAGRVVIANTEYRRFLPNGIMPSRDPDRGWRWQAWDEEEHPIRTEDFPGARALRGERVVPGQVMLYTGDEGQQIWTRVATVPIRAADGRVTGQASVISDIDALKRSTDALRESEERFRGLVEGFGQATWEADASGVIVTNSPGWCAFTGQSPEEWLGYGWLDAIHPDDRAATERKWRETVATGCPVDAEYRLWHAESGSWRWSNVRAVPITGTGGRILKWAGMNIDVTEYHETRERQAVLVAELQHRTRNLMGMVRALMDKAVARSSDLADFRARFGTRLAALARVQGLLSRLDAWDRVTFDQILDSELSALNGEDGRLTLDGPKGVALRSSTVQTVALALHELITNAIKYGALAQAGGRLGIVWRVERTEADGQPWLHVDWRERGVAMPADDGSPRRSGSGRELIERALPYQFGARTRYTMGADGVHCTIALPVSERQRVNGRAED